MPLFARLFEKNAVRAALMCLLGLLACLSLYAGIKNALVYSQDFQWDAAKALSMRLDPYELSKDQKRAAEYPELEQFYRMFTDRGLKQNMEANQFPSLLVLLWPMTLFSPQTAKVVWLALNLLFTGGIVWLLRKTFFEKAKMFDFAVLMLLMLAGTPYRNQLGVGQHTLFAFFFFMLAVYFERSRGIKNKAMQTAAVSLCLFVSYFKYTLTAPLALYFQYRKKYKEVVLSVLGHAALTGICALWLDRSFIYLIKAPLEVASRLTSEGGIDLGVLLGAKAGMAAAAVIALLLVFMTLKYPADGEYILFSVLILWSLILTYHRTYDFFVFSVAALLFCGRLSEETGEKIKNALVCWYAVLLVALYFVLRLFSENTASKIAVGILYYGFTIFVSILAVKMLRDKNKDNG